MYRPSMYNKHDETMLKFVEKFNGSLVCKNIEMRPNKVETYDNDGIFIDIYTNQSIGSIETGISRIVNWNLKV